MKNGEEKCKKNQNTLHISAECGTFENEFHILGILMILLTCNNLSVGHEGKGIASGISFHVDTGDYMCVVGENGSGKSTLIKTLAGLLPPLSGEIVLSESLKKYGIGYLPQQSAIQRSFPASVFEVVLSGFQNRLGFSPFYKKSYKMRVIDNLRLLGMEDFAKRCYGELSGGQQQRVLLARALCSAKDLLVMDEPVTGLDPESAKEMYSLVSRLNKELGMSVIMISHDIDSVKKYATHILRLANGGATFLKNAETCSQ